MTPTIIRKLLQRYFAGNSSLEEEATLRAYFRRPEVEEEFRAYAPLFTYWERERHRRMPTDRRSARRRRKILQPLLAIAATLLLVLMTYRYQRSASPVGEGFPIAERQEIDWSRYEVTDRREAVRVLHRSLDLAGEQLQRGPAITLRQLRKANEIIQ